MDDIIRAMEAYSDLGAVIIARAIDDITRAMKANGIARAIEADTVMGPIEPRLYNCIGKEGVLCPK